MKTFALALVASASADNKVPSHHPLQGLENLSLFADEWCKDNLIPKESDHWRNKFERNVARFERRWALCGIFDENQPQHGDLLENCEVAQNPLCQYDKKNPINGILQISNGFSEFAQRYLTKCKVQPGRQIDRANKWFNILTNKYVAKN